MVTNAREMSDPAVAIEADASGSRSHVLKGSDIRISETPKVLTYPGMDEESILTVEREDGVVRGFRYHCSCGRTDHFICD